MLFHFDVAISAHNIALERLFVRCVFVQNISVYEKSIFRICSYDFVHMIAFGQISYVFCARVSFELKNVGNMSVRFLLLFVFVVKSLFYSFVLRSACITY